MGKRTVEESEKPQIFLSACTCSSPPTYSDVMLLCRLGADSLGSWSDKRMQLLCYGIIDTIIAILHVLVR